MSDKIEVKSFEMDLRTGKVEQKHNSYIYKDEEPNCNDFVNLGMQGCINVCFGNEPYSCHRAKKEGLCYKQKE